MTSEDSRNPRTLADALRSADDSVLSALLRARPDLLSPLPGDLSQLATRAGTRTSVLRALERLDTFALQTAEALAVAPQPCTRSALAELLPGGEEELPRALATLRTRALLWGGDDGLRLVRTAQELLAPAAGRPSATGLGPSLAEATSGLPPSRMQQLLTTAGLPATHDPVTALAALHRLFTEPARMTALLETAPEQARAALDRLRWGPPYGEVSARPGPHLRWLIDRGLLVPTAPGTVVLPREVALHLRGGRAHRELRPSAPVVPVHARFEPGTADAAGGGQAFTALSLMEELLTGWETDAPPVLRAGGLGVRELRRTAAALEVPEPETVFWIELAYAAGLVAADGETDARYAPTPAYDEWLRQPPEDRWVLLAAAWLAGTRVPGLVGGRDSRGRALAALGPGLDRGPAAELRRRALRLLAGLDEGSAPDPTGVLEHLRWEQPRRMPDELRATLGGAVLTEAERLGVTGRGALTGFVRPLLETGSAVDRGAARVSAADLLRPLLPEPLDHILLQADLTAVAPGPLQPELGRTLAVAAEVESKGGATVFRFTPGSVRRALDAGWSAAELHTFLAKHSRTPVPQPLSYLVDDVARRHGLLRVGAVSSYLRCDDTALLDQLLADRRSESLRLRRIAPTVLVSGTVPEVLLERLRELGLAPAAEAGDGTVLTASRAVRRTPPRSAPEPVPDSPPAADGPLLAAAVRAIRAGDHAAGAAPRPAVRVPESEGRHGGLPRTSAADTLTTLTSAARSGALVWIGYVGADGVAGQRVLAPVRVEGGFVTAFDHTADEVRTYPLHRITGTAELADS
ncbi:helicase-associated domain-containing protein [Streptomyces sp. ACA25]|uniref:helicase-associated domain-containing protein n=1 Tax=Streptomyces sp. ACA25 TaxID=3022596 RepID=UPI002307C026|nr:helicase-associated domain-containing protein [Streptomyces sp. ACA25]MDB1088077.1 helicase-associated domain-containing protein [Streptomyces sp. ACA25]